MQGSQNLEIFRRDNFVTQKKFEVIGCEISNFLAETNRAKIPWSLTFVILVAPKGAVFLKGFFSRVPSSGFVDNRRMLPRMDTRILF